MTQDSNTEGTQPTDEQTDNELIRSLRDQIKDLQKQVKGAPTRESVEEEIRTELERESAISEQLVALGHPKGLSEFLKGKLGENEVTQESVAEALQGIGYQVEVDGAASDNDEGEASSQESELARVANLSNQVRSAASGGGDPSETLSKKINSASSQQEIADLMEEAGLAASYE